MNEAIPKNINYLIPESGNTSKRANAVASYRHHYLYNYGLGETNFYLHADNCSGKNKNNGGLFVDYRMKYLVISTIIGK